MSLKVNFELMAEYNQSMNKSIYAAMSQLSAIDLSLDRGAFFGSLSGTLNHILVGDIIWLQRFAKCDSSLTSLNYVCSLDTPKTLNQIVFEDFAQLTKCRFKLDTHIRKFASELTDELIVSALTYRNVKGQLFTQNFGFLIQHLFNHQTHHRGQISTLLNQLGIDIGETDLLINIPEI